jgi:hypothetical protein
MHRAARNAVACEGVDIRIIEADEDPGMAELRAPLPPSTRCNAAIARPGC